MKPSTALIRLAIVYVSFMATSAAEGLGTIVEVLRSKTGQFSTLLNAIRVAELEDALAQNGSSLTLFAPTNEAFSALPDGALAKLMASPSTMRKLLLDHASKGVYSLMTLGNGDALPTLNNSVNKIAISGAAITVNGANVIGGEMKAKNGLILVVDRVLI